MVLKPLQILVIVALLFSYSLPVHAYLQPPSQTYMDPSQLPQLVAINDCDLFVATHGNNDNSGLSEAQALKTISAGIDSISPGKTLCIKNGTYQDVAISGLVGTPSQQITIGRYEPNGKVMIDGNNYTKEGLTIDNSKFLNIIGLEVTKSKRVGVYISDSWDLDLVNLNIHHNFEDGLMIKQGGRIRIEHSQFWYNLMDRKISAGVGGGAIGVHTSKEGALRWNKIYRNFGEGINIGRDSNMILIEGNQAWENDHTAYYVNRASNILFHKNLMICTGDKSTWHTEEGINSKMDSTGKAFTFVNEDANPKTRLLCPYDGGGNNALINNISMGCTTHFHMGIQDDGVCPAQLGKVLIAHNTFIDAKKDRTPDAKIPDFFDLGTENDPYSDTVAIINNTVVQHDPSSRVFAKPAVVNSPKLTVTNNYTNRNPNVSKGFVVANLPFVAQYTQSGLQKPPNIDPTLSRLTTNLNYARLAPNSPAINAGIAISGFPMFTRYLGSDFFSQSRLGNPDVGAHESDGTQPPSTNPSPTPPDDDPTITPADEPTSPPDTITADFNDDGKVDYRDVLMFIPKFDKSNALYNLNGTGKVDVFDFGMVISQLF